MSMTEETAKALRAPFSADAIGKLPKGGTQLDYVGHAAVTDRLLTVDPEWVWEPVAWDADGTPLIRYGAKEATLWIRLTICGVTRLGVGSVAVSAFEVEKQLIGDALRNAAMRFGVALDLWSKEPIHEPEVPPFDPNVDADAHEVEKLRARITQVDESVRLAFLAWKNDQQFPWPWPAKACVQMHAELDRLETSDPMPAETDPPAGRSEETPDGYIPGGPGVEAGEGSGNPTPEPPADYSEWPVNRLKAELEARSLSVSGTRAQLIDRLQMEIL